MCARVLCNGSNLDVTCSSLAGAFRRFRRFSDSTFFPQLVLCSLLDLEKQHRQHPASPSMARKKHTLDDDHSSSDDEQQDRGVTQQDLEDERERFRGMLRSHTTKSQQIAYRQHA